MIRSIRRALRGWKTEVGSFWGRFNTFYRMVIGIALAMAMVYGGRAALLDPRQKELKTITEKLAKDSVADTIPSADSDEEVQQPKLKTENARRNIEERKEVLQKMETDTKYDIGATVSNATGKIVAIASTYGLNVYENSDCDAIPAVPAGEVKDKSSKENSEKDKEKPAPQKGNSPVPLAAKQFELRGDFLSIRNFLQNAERAPLLWKITDVSIILLRDEHGAPYLMPGGRPMLSLRFRMILHLYKGRWYELLVAGRRLALVHLLHDWSRQVTGCIRLVGHCDPVREIGQACD